MAGRTVPMDGYRSKVVAMEPTAYGRGSTSVAPACRAATVPAPNGIPPCVMVGPSSTTSTRLPANDWPGSRVTGDAARTTMASGFVAYTLATTRPTAAGSALSVLLTTTMSAIRKFSSPGW
jgi:hypothetical protein